MALRHPEPAPRSLLVGLAAGQHAGWVRDQLTDSARLAVEHTHPEHHDVMQAARTAAEQARQVERSYAHKLDVLGEHLTRHGCLTIANDPEAMLSRAEAQVTDLTGQHEQVTRTVAALLAEPAIRSLPPDRVTDEHASWRQDRHDRRQAARRAEIAEQAAILARDSRPKPYDHSTGHLPGTGHHGPWSLRPDHRPARPRHQQI